MTNSKYIVCLMFSGSQAKPNGISKVYSYRKVDREIHTLAQWHMIGHQLFVSESTGNVFSLHKGMFEITM